MSGIRGRRRGRDGCWRLLIAMRLWMNCLCGMILKVSKVRNITSSYVWYVFAGFTDNGCWYQPAFAIPSTTPTLSVTT